MTLTKLANENQEHLLSLPAEVALVGAKDGGFALGSMGAGFGLLSGGINNAESLKNIALRRSSPDEIKGALKSIGKSVIDYHVPAAALGVGVGGVMANLALKDYQNYSGNVLNKEAANHQDEVKRHKEKFKEKQNNAFREDRRFSEDRGLEGTLIGTGAGAISGGLIGQGIAKDRIPLSWALNERLKGVYRGLESLSEEEGNAEHVRPTVDLDPETGKPISSVFYPLSEDMSSREAYEARKLMAERYEKLKDVIRRGASPFKKAAPLLGAATLGSVGATLGGAVGEIPKQVDAMLIEPAEHSRNKVLIRRGLETSDLADDIPGMTDDTSGPVAYGLAGIAAGTLPAVSGRVARLLQGQRNRGGLSVSKALLRPSARVSLGAALPVAGGALGLALGKIDEMRNES